MRDQGRDKGTEIQRKENKRRKVIEAAHYYAQHKIKIRMQKRRKMKYEKRHNEKRHNAKLNVICKRGEHKRKEEDEGERKGKTGRTSRRVIRNKAVATQRRSSRKATDWLDGKTTLRFITAQKHKRKEGRKHERRKAKMQTRREDTAKQEHAEQTRQTKTSKNRHTKKKKTRQDEK